MQWMEGSRRQREKESVVRKWVGKRNEILQYNTSIVIYI